MSVTRIKSITYCKTIFSLILSVFILINFASAYNPQYLDETKNTKLRWKNNTITIAISTSLNKLAINAKSESDVIEAVRRSFASWESVADIKLVEVSNEKQTVSPSGMTGDGVSLITIAQTPENLLMFAGDTKEIAARTRVFFNRKGFITEADIVLNPYQQFSTDGTFGTFDLESTLTHEIGHLLGLDHSSVIGSTMQIHQGKNGTYSLPNFTARTLAEDDISGIRSIYGTKEVDCCGGINGKILLKSGKPAYNFKIWAEENETARIIAGISVNNDGSFKLEGLRSGKYRLFAQDKNNQTKFAPEKIDDVVVEKNKTVKFERQLLNKPKTVNLNYIGFNAQLSKLAVPVNQGKSFLIYVGGEHFDSDEIEVSFNSPFFSIIPNSFINHDYGNKISGISFEVLVSQKAVNGEYSLKITNKYNSTDYLVGSLTIDEFINPMNTKFLLFEE